MSANILVSKYMAAKQAMIDGYRGMHKAPAYTTWGEVQGLQDQMQSAAVELAEYMASIKDGSWREAINGTPETESLTPIQWLKVDEVERDSFYSKTSKGNRPMWRLRTTDGRQVNIFDHADPLRDQKSLIQDAGYWDFFNLMNEGQIDHWTTTPIEVEIERDGSFWKLIQINHRVEGSAPDEPETVADVFSDDENDAQ